MSLPILKLGSNSKHPAFVTDEKELVSDRVLIQSAVDLRRAETYRAQREAFASFVMKVGALTDTVLPSKNRRQGRLSLASSLIVFTAKDGILEPNVEEVKAVFGGHIPRQEAKLDYIGNGTGFVVVHLASRNPASRAIDDGELPIVGADITEEARTANRIADTVIWDASVALTEIGRVVGGELGLYKSVQQQLAA